MEIKGEGGKKRLREVKKRLKESQNTSQTFSSVHSCHCLLHILKDRSTVPSSLLGAVET